MCPNKFQASKIVFKNKRYSNSAEKIREIGDEPLKESLRKLGGWPMVDGPDWKVPPTILEDLLGTLSVDYNQGVLLIQTVGPDDKNSSRNILQVRRQSKTLNPL